jgi:hypothetical protein
MTGKAPAPVPITVELAFSRSTKGTHVFTATAEAAAVTTLYVVKHALGDEPPQRLSLTIAPAS